MVLPELSAINRDLAEGKLTPERARVLVEDLRRRLEPPRPASFVSENERLALEYWDAVGAHKQISAPRAAKDRLLWAVRQLGATPLLTINQAFVNKALAHLTPNRRRAALAGPAS